MKTIEIVVAPDGSTQIETRGFAGKTCLDASRFLEAALGQKTSERMTPEYYASADEADRLRNRE